MRCHSIGERSQAKFTNMSGVEELNMSVVNRILDFQIVESSLSIVSWSYSSLRDTPIIGSRVDAAVQAGVKRVATPVKEVAYSVAESYPNQVAKFNSTACALLDVIEEKLPALQKQPGKIVQDVRGIVRSSTRAVLRTFPGRQMLSVLNYSINTTESLLERFEGTGRNSKSGKTAKSVSSEGCSPAQSAQKVKRSRRTPCFIIRLVQLPITTPLNIMYFFLVAGKQALVVIAGKKSRCHTLSPSKVAEIKSRKRVSPRKKQIQAPPGILNIVMRPLRSVLVRVWIRSTIVTRPLRSVLIRSPSTNEPARNYLVPIKEEGEKSVTGDSTADSDRGTVEKRKHDDLETASEASSEEELNIYGLDEDYRSDDDPDYIPEPIDSAHEYSDYSGGETESDIEIEEVVDEHGAVVKQVKNTPKGKRIKTEKNLNEQNQKDGENKDKAEDMNLGPGDQLQAPEKTSEETANENQTTTEPPVNEEANQENVTSEDHGHMG